jgi:hypothetical protein
VRRTWVTYREVESLEADDLDEGVAGQVDKGQDEEETSEGKKAHVHVLFPVFKRIFLAQ